MHISDWSSDVCPSDLALLGKLSYRAPALLRRAVDLARAPVTLPMAILDLGCGTGLAGEAFKGVDLSPGMVIRARKRGIYDALSVAELTDALQRTERRFDLVLAADVMA